MTENFVDPLQVFDADKELINFRNMLRRTPAAFLIGGGPSLNSMALNQLDRRGIFTMCVNNVAGHPGFRPSAFVCSDPPKKFHLGIWLDPGVMKFIPITKLKPGRGSLRRKMGSEFEPTGFSACHCPNVWGFLRRTWMKPDDSFFTDNHATLGNLDAGVDRTGEEKTACTMLLGIRLLYYFGIRRIFLAGVDFNMQEGYSFPQNRDRDAIISNNDQFRVVNAWLCRMVEGGVFERFGLEILNTNTETELKAFPTIPFRNAVKTCLTGFPPTPFDLAGWYEK